MAIGTTLILAEKKDVADALSGVLPGSDRAQTRGLLITQDQYLITWVSGHAMKLMEPEDYIPELKKWSIEQLPINFRNWKVKPKANKVQHLQSIQQWLRQADTVIHAGDPDQEGQLLIDEILREYNYRGNVLRVNTSDITDAGLRMALANMESNKGYESAGWSAYARGVADLLVGVNMSRLFSTMHGTLLTVGRVQTPTLGLVVARDMLIESHQKVKYYTISGNLVLDNGASVVAKYEYPENFPELSDGKVLEPRVAERHAAELKGMLLRNIEVTKKIANEKPPLPFNMVKLQTYCSKKFNMSLETVMEATQSLRDKHKAITYNRSSCQYLKDTHYAEAPDTMETVIRNIHYRPKALDMTLKSDCFNDKHVEIHHAIIPTNQDIDLNNFTPAERDVYLAIVKYYMAQFMPPAKKEITRLAAVTDGGGRFTATSTVILDPGYRAIFSELEKDEVSSLSNLPAGKYQGTVSETTVTERETKPPARYTQATLAEDMTCISKYVQDPRIKQILRDKDKDKEEENGSIGTVATRTPIIKGLIEKGFLEDDGKHVKSTPIGRELYRILPDEIKGVDVTAEWWLFCEAIVAGRAKPEDLQNDVLRKINGIIANRNSYPKPDPSIIAAAQRNKGPVVVGTCPRCQNNVIEGKVGFGCSNWKAGCKFVIWKKPKPEVFKNITITEKRAISLLAGERVKIDNLYSPRKQTNFTGYISLNDEERSDFGPKLDISYDNKKSAGSQRKAPARKAPDRKTPSRSQSKKK